MPTVLRTKASLTSAKNYEGWCVKERGGFHKNLFNNSAVAIVWGEEEYLEQCRKITSKIHWNLTLHPK